MTVQETAGVGVGVWVRVGVGGSGVGVRVGVEVGPAGVGVLVGVGVGGALTVISCVSEQTAAPPPTVA